MLLRYTVSLLERIPNKTRTKLPLLLLCQSTFIKKTAPAFTSDNITVSVLYLILSQVIIMSSFNENKYYCNTNHNVE